MNVPESPEVRREMRRRELGRARVARYRQRMEEAGFMPVTFYLSRKARKRLASIAKKQGRTKSQIVEDAINNWKGEA